MYSSPLLSIALLLCQVIGLTLEWMDDRKQFDPDTRDQTVTNIVHGSWKAEDRNGIGIQVIYLSI